MAKFEERLAKARERQRLIEELGGRGISEREKALEEKQAREEELSGYGEIADIIGQGLVKFGAAREGLKSGVDLSGVSSTGYDWGAARERARKKYAGEFGRLAEERKGVEDLAKEVDTEDKARSLKMAVGVVSQEGLPVYQIAGQPGYVDANYQPVADVKKYEKPSPERADSYFTKIIEDKSMLTESGLPVYKKTITNKANPSEFSIELVDIEGNPIEEDIKPKVGLDPKALLSDREVEALSAAEAAVEMFDVIKTDKPKYDTGPVANFRNWLGQKVGVDDPDISSFKADVQDTLNRYIKQMTGAQMSEAEAERLMAAMPKFSDNDETFKKKLENAQKRITLYNDRYKKRLSMKGKDVGEEVPQSPAQGGKVRLRYKDGRIFELDADKAEKALESGDWERE